MLHVCRQRNSGKVFQGVPGKIDLFVHSQAGGYGRDLATDFASLHWESDFYRLEELPDGTTKLSIALSSVSYTHDMSSLTISARVLDALNQTVISAPLSGKSAL